LKAIYKNRKSFDLLFDLNSTAFEYPLSPTHFYFQFLPFLKVKPNTYLPSAQSRFGFAILKSCGANIFPQDRKPMNKEELEVFQTKLIERLGGIEAAIAAFKTELVEATQNQTSFLQDGMDHAQELSDLGTRIEIHERNMVTRQQLRMALEKIRLGTFGECVECGEPINPRRMEALPTAVCCVGCKTKCGDQDRVGPANDVAWITPDQLFNLFVPREAA
jgi:DnaK suppressor protein